MGAPQVPSEFVTFSVKTLLVTLSVKTLLLVPPTPPWAKSSDANRETLISFFGALLVPLTLEGAPLELVFVPALEKSLEGNDRPGFEPALMRGVSDLSRGWSSPAAIPKHRDCAAANRRSDSVTYVCMREKGRNKCAHECGNPSERAIEFVVNCAI